MSFERVRRGVIENYKPFPVQPNTVVLQWKDSPPSPSLMIYIGEDIVREMQPDHRSRHATLFIGVGADAGKCGIRFAGTGDWDYRVLPHMGGRKIFLPSRVSVQHFTFCERTEISPEDISIRDGMLIFAYAGVRP